MSKINRTMKNEKICVWYNQADIDATVAAAMVDKLGLADVVERNSYISFSKYDRIVSIGNRPTVADTVGPLRNQQWTIIRRKDGADKKPTLLQKVSSFFNPEEAEVPATNVIEVIVREDGEVIHHDSYLREVLRWFVVEPENAGITSDTLEWYERTVYEMTRNPHLPLLDQILLLDIHEAARDRLLNEMFNFTIPTDTPSMLKELKWKQFHKKLQSEVEAKLDTEMVVIPIKWFGKDTIKSVPIRTINAEMWKTQWIQRMVSHCSEGLVVYEFTGKTKARYEPCPFTELGKLGMNKMLRFT